MRKPLRMLAVAATTLLLAAPAQAAPVIEFSPGSAVDGGSLWWDGTNTVGSNIPVGAVTISQAATNNNVFVVNGPLSDSGGGSYGSLDFHARYYTNMSDTFATITGCIPALAIGTIDGSGNCTQPVTLLSGANVFSSGLRYSMTALQVIYVDNKHAALLEAIGYTANIPPVYADYPWVAITNLYVNSSRSPFAVTSSHTFNYARTPDVPEPASIVLLATGLCAVFGVRRARVSTPRPRN